MPAITRILIIALTLIACVSGHLAAVDGKVSTIAGLIDRLDADNSKVVIKTVSPDPTKVKTAVINVDKTSTITIDKMASGFDDLKVGDQVVIKYSQGVAATIVVTRAPPSSAKNAAPPAKP
jgi:hypothetical protein